MHTHSCPGFPLICSLSNGGEYVTEGMLSGQSSFVRALTRTI
ncbi:MAG: hypothetical protein WCI28_02000 [Opitutaceae bacterium]